MPPIWPAWKLTQSHQTHHPIRRLPIYILIYWNTSTSPTTKWNLISHAQHSCSAKSRKICTRSGSDKPIQSTQIYHPDQCPTTLADLPQNQQGTDQTDSNITHIHNISHKSQLECENTPILTQNITTEAVVKFYYEHTATIIAPNQVQTLSHGPNTTNRVAVLNITPDSINTGFPFQIYGHTGRHLYVDSQHHNNFQSVSISNFTPFFIRLHFLAPGSVQQYRPRINLKKNKNSQSKVPPQDQH